MAWIRDDLTGRKFGKLTVTRKYEERGSRWVCVCECGTEKVLRACRLLRGNDKSCGCLKRTVLGDATRKHGKANSRVTGYASRTYGIWQAMRARCTNPNNNRWASYGGRGIKVDPAWNDFEQFVRDMGEVPENLTLDRIDPDGDYTKENCRWATWLEQAHNKRRKKGASYGG